MSEEKPSDSRRDAKTGRFVKGSSGNPSGRPPGPNPHRVLVNMVSEAQADGRSKLEHLFETIIAQAMGGCLDSQKLLVCRLIPAQLAARVAAEPETLLTIRRVFAGGGSAPETLPPKIATSPDPPRLPEATEPEGKSDPDADRWPGSTIEIDPETGEELESFTLK